MKLRKLVAIKLAEVPAFFFAGVGLMSWPNGPDSLFSMIIVPLAVTAMLYTVWLYFPIQIALIWMLRNRGVVGAVIATAVGGIHIGSIGYLASKGVAEIAVPMTVCVTIMMVVMFLVNIAIMLTQEDRMTGV